jgi:putative pyruvate formate lyase activating enzyme
MSGNGVQSGRIPADGLEALYQECRLCPRDCGVDRLRGERGVCGESAGVRVAWAGLHRGEEPPLTGGNGSGTIFFSGCTLKCGSCQNCQISHEAMGRVMLGTELAELMLRLQERGAANVNLVTASHFVPSVAVSVSAARNQGLAIPVVWNSSGYEAPAALRMLQDAVDVYLPDCKTLDSEVSRRLMRAPDYPEVVRAALLEMVEGKPLAVRAERILQGVIVRHLVLPGFLNQSREVLEWFARTLKDRALLSLMFQYTPVRLTRADTNRHPNRTIGAREYDRVLSWLVELGIDDGYVQDPATGDEWLPDFTRPNPFPEGQAVPLWHCRFGYLK